MGIRRSGQRTGFYLPHRWLSSASDRPCATTAAHRIAHTRPIWHFGASRALASGTMLATGRESAVIDSTDDDFAPNLLERAGGPRRRARPGRRRRARAATPSRRAGSRFPTSTPRSSARTWRRSVRRGRTAPRACGRSTSPRTSCSPSSRRSTPTVLRIAAEVPATGKIVLLACPPGSTTSSACACSPTASSSRAGTSPTSAPTLRCSRSSLPPRRRGADLVALSSSTVFERVELRSFIDSLRRRCRACASSSAARRSRRDRSWPAEDLLDPAELGLPGSRPAG